MPRELEGNAGPVHGNWAIVVARYNESITGNLLRGALATLAEHGIPDEAVTVAWVPGAWEVPLVASRLAHSGQFAAVICLAAVIRGETTHDQYINQQVSQSLGRLAIDAQVPVLFGILTCNSLEQAIQRSGGRVGNKGSECALAALQLVDLLSQLPELTRPLTHPCPTLPHPNPESIPMSRRSRAREVVLQVLYQDDLNPGHDLHESDNFVRGRLHHDAELVDFALRLLSGTRRNRPELDGLLTAREQLESGTHGGHRPQYPAPGGLRDPPHADPRTSGDRRGGGAGQTLRFAAVGTICQRDSGRTAVWKDRSGRRIKMGLFDRFRRGLKRTSDLLQTDIRDLFKQDGQLVDDAFLDRLYALLVRTDMGSGPAQQIRDEIQQQFRGRVVHMEDVLDHVKRQLLQLINQAESPLRRAEQGPTMVLVVGVNGSGKTTSIAKLARMYLDQGCQVVLGAGDTFRAAAVEQLTVWAQRIGAEIVTGASGSDPASVAHRARGAHAGAGGRSLHHRHRGTAADPVQPDGTVGEDPPRGPETSRWRTARSPAGAGCHGRTERH